MKKKSLVIGLFAFIIAATIFVIFSFVNNWTITKVTIETPKNSQTVLTVTNRKQISSLMKSLHAAKREKGAILSKTSLNDNTNKITIYYKNNKTQCIRLLLGSEGSTYYYDNYFYPAYTLSAKASKKINLLLLDIQK